MSAGLITDEGTVIERYDVIGQLENSADGFVRHLGLAANEHSSLVKEDTVEAIEVGPPLQRGNEWSPDVHATAELNYDEQMRVDLFYREHKSEHESRGLIKGLGRYRAYVIVPHCKPIYEKDGTEVTKRFNCVGFVIEAYRDAGIQFICVDLEVLPKVSEAVLSLVNPLFRSPEWKKYNQRFDFGLDHSCSEWPVMLPGYAINALSRDRNDIRNNPYVPKREDAYFSR